MPDEYVTVRGPLPMTPQMAELFGCRALPDGGFEFELSRDLAEAFIASGVIKRES